VNDVVANPDRAHVDIGHTLSTNAASGVLANDSDPNDTLTVSAVDGATTNVGHALKGNYGTLTLNADGSYAYVAAHHERALPHDGVGVDSFNYTVTDQAGITATTTLTIVVTSSGHTYLGGTAGVTLDSGRNRDPVPDVRIPTKPAMHSNMKPATHSETKPATIPI
jgi:VCBS repeat-containing protein